MHNSCLDCSPLAGAGRRFPDAAHGLRDGQPCGVRGAPRPLEPQPAVGPPRHRPRQPRPGPQHRQPRGRVRGGELWSPHQHGEYSPLFLSYFCAFFLPSMYLVNYFYYCVARSSSWKPISCSQSLRRSAQVRSAHVR